MTNDTSPEIGNSSFRVGDFHVDPGLNQIKRGDELTHVEPKVMDVLCVLANAAGKTVARDKILKTVWRNRVVVEETLTRAVSQLRAAFSDNPRNPAIVQTVPRRGYRLTATVSIPNDTATISENIDVPHTRRPWTRIAVFAVAVVAALIFVGNRTRDVAPKPSESASVAVLPFTNMSGDPSQEFFSDGITEEVLNALTRIDGLKVTGRTSSFSFKNRDVDLPTIGEALNVSTILEGSVRRSGDRLRVTAQLINAADGFHLWSKTYDRGVADIFDIQEEIAQSIAHELQLSLTPDTPQSYEHRRTEDLDAYSLYLQGKDFMHRSGVDNLHKASDAFYTAIEFDPDFVPAYTHYVWACLATPFWGHQILPQCAREVQPLMQRAYELDPTSAEVLIAQSIIDEMALDVRGARRIQERAFARDSSNAYVLHNHAYSLLFIWDEPLPALKLLNRRLAMEPLFLTVRLMRARALTQLGRFDSAEDELEQVIRMDPEYAGGYRSLGNLFVIHRNQYVKGVTYFKKAIELQPNYARASFALASAFLDLGDNDAASFWSARCESLAPGSYLARIVAFQSAIAEQEYAEADALSRQLGAYDANIYDLLLFEMRDLAWLRHLQRRDPELALEVYARSYRGLLDPEPNVAAWNQAAAIGLAELRLSQGDDVQAARLLDQVDAFLTDKPNSRYRSARVAVHALRGDIEIALDTLQAAANEGWRAGWRELERDPVYEVLWDEPQFAAIVSELKTEMALQLAALAAHEN